MSRPYSDYLLAAFNARPAGMFVAPNWVGLGIAGLLGFLNPGFWLLGAGLEVAYLVGLANFPRFRRAVDSAARVDGARASGNDSRLTAMKAGLPAGDLERYQEFSNKCRRTMLAVPDNTALHETLAHVAWLFLQLLQSRLTVARLLQTSRAENEEDGTLESRLAAVERRLAEGLPAEDLRRTLESTRDILTERLRAQGEMESKQGYVDAELSRLEEQLSLLHDRAQLDRDAPGLNSSIDRVTAGISGATDWMSREKELLGDLGGTYDEPPPAAIFESER
ncbi:MAG: uncharacterized protein JWL81_1153 [Verrucomicrobiales bacterium]|nr:uncharacterized protein [Verrucomicrobiales bacterium]